MQRRAVPDSDAVTDDCGLGLAAAAVQAVLCNVDDGVVLDVGLIPDLDCVDVACICTRCMQQ